MINKVNYTKSIRKQFIFKKYEVDNIECGFRTTVEYGIKIEYNNFKLIYQPLILALLV